MIKGGSSKGSVRYDAALFLKSALVAAADDSRLLSLFKKELGNHQDAGRLPRAAGRNIADADDGNPRLDRIGRFPGNKANYASCWGNGQCVRFATFAITTVL